jgi:hypothetical protein
VAADAPAPGAPAPLPPETSREAPSATTASVAGAEVEPTPQDPVPVVRAALDRATGGIVGVWVCRFPGLAALADEADGARARLGAAVRAGLRPGDRLVWSADEDLVVVTPGADIDAAPLETRLLRALRPHLARIAARAPEPIEIWIGAANAPRDGETPAALLDTALRRLR